MSQIRIVASLDTEMSREPSRVKVGGPTRSRWPRSTVIRSPLRASQSRRVRSSDAVTRRVPSGLKVACPLTGPVCPRSTAISRPVSPSQSRPVWSIDAEASLVPSRLNARRLTVFVCPDRIPISLPADVSHSRTSQSGYVPPIASRAPSALKAIAMPGDFRSSSLAISPPVPPSRISTGVVPPPWVTTNCFPSGLKKIRSTGPPGASSAASWRPVSAS